jgi:hypothetical protein
LKKSQNQIWKIEVTVMSTKKNEIGVVENGDEGEREHGR